MPDDLLVVVDELYTESLAARSGRTDCRNHRDHRPNVAVLRTFSKAYGLAGLRVGFAVAHPEVMRGLRLTSVPFGVPTIAQAAGVASLDAEAQLLERVEGIVAERDRVEAALDALGVERPRSQANFVWLRTGESTDQLVEACDAVNLSVRAYGTDGVRVTIGEPEANDRFLQVVSARPDLAGR